MQLRLNEMNLEKKKWERERERHLKRGFSAILSKHIQTF